MSLDPSANRPMTKESLLNQVDTLRDLARRSRRLAAAMEADVDRRRLAQHAEELDGNADRLEKAAVEARTFLISSGPVRQPRK